MRNLLQRKLVLAALLACVLGLCFALLLPPSSGPDEKGHIVYIASLASGQLPGIPSSNTADFADHTTYEAQQPPLFYLAAAPGYALLGHDPLRGLYLARLLCVAALAVTVWCIGLLARELWGEKTATIAAFLVATNPVIVYVCSMANNEAWAVAFSALAAVAAVKVGQCSSEEKTKRAWFMVFAVLLGGCALLSKLTALAGIVAAVWLVGGSCLRHDDAKAEDMSHWSPIPRTVRVMRMTVLFFGASALWTLWGIYMLIQHGNFMPSPFNNPLYRGGPGALLLFPFEALFYAFILTTGLAIGLVQPQWLQQNGAIYFFLTDSCSTTCHTFVYALFGVGVWIIAWLIFGAWRVRALQFLPFSFAIIALMLIGNMFFRDLDNIYAPARYAPVVAIFVMLLAASQYRLCRPAIQKTLVVLWCGLSLLQILQIYQFFL